MIFGDLERVLAQLYPYRVTIAIGLVIGLAGLAFLARRRHWGSVVGRNPRASLLVTIAVLAVGSPSAGFSARLCSSGPRSARTTPLLSEGPAPPPTRRRDRRAPGPTRASSSRVSSTAPTSSTSGAARRCSSTPRSGGIPSASRDSRSATGRTRSPTPSPAADGDAAGALKLGVLKVIDGAFNYEVPMGTDIGHFKSAVVWCRAFGVLFATAPLAAT